MKQALSLCSEMIFAAPLNKNFPQKIINAVSALNSKVNKRALKFNA
jgi:hypothetical protein